MLSPGTNKRVDDRCQLQLIGAHYPLVAPWMHLHCTCTGLALDLHSQVMLALLRKTHRDKHCREAYCTQYHFIVLHLLSHAPLAPIAQSHKKIRYDGLDLIGQMPISGDFVRVYLPCWIYTESTRTNVNRLKFVALYDSLIIKWRPRPRIRVVIVRYCCLIFVNSTNISKNIETALLSIVSKPHIRVEMPTVTLHHSVDSLHFVLLFFFSCFAAKNRARP